MGCAGPRPAPRRASSGDPPPAPSECPAGRPGRRACPPTVKGHPPVTHGLMGGPTVRRREPGTRRPRRPRSGHCRRPFGRPPGVSVPPTVLAASPRARAWVSHQNTRPAGRRGATGWPCRGGLGRKWWGQRRAPRPAEGPPAATDRGRPTAPQRRRRGTMRPQRRRVWARVAPRRAGHGRAPPSANGSSRNLHVASTPALPPRSPALAVGVGAGARRGGPPRPGGGAGRPQGGSSSSAERGGRCACGGRPAPLGTPRPRRGGERGGLDGSPPHGLSVTARTAACGPPAVWGHAPPRQASGARGCLVAAGAAAPCGGRGRRRGRALVPTSSSLPRRRRRCRAASPCGGAARKDWQQQRLLPLLTLTFPSTTGQQRRYDLGIGLYPHPRTPLAAHSSFPLCLICGPLWRVSHVRTVSKSLAATLPPCAHGAWMLTFRKAAAAAP